jgi:hypothetical protein
MEIQYGKMILYGILQAVLYIAVPLIIIYFVELYNIMTFSQDFITYLMVIGCIGVALSMAKHAFPSDTSANRIVAFIGAIFSGIYLFYIFGGFTPGVSLGTYYIDIPNLQVLLGLQVIAWLFLISTGISALKYLIEAIELRKKREYQIKAKKSFKLSRIFKGLGTIMSLVILGYFASIVISGMISYRGISLHDPAPPDYDNKGTPSFLDDSLNFTLTFDINNQGLYAIYDVTIFLNIYTETTTNDTVLPEYTKIGTSSGYYYSAFHAFTFTPDQSIIATIFPMYIEGLISTNATLKFQISFSTLYANIDIAVNASISFPWNVP